MSSELFPRLLRSRVGKKCETCLGHHESKSDLHEIGKVDPGRDCSDWEFVRRTDQLNQDRTGKDKTVERTQSDECDRDGIVLHAE